MKEDLVLKIPAQLKPEVAAPLLCAGVTTCSPLKRWGVKAGSKVGVTGMGGLRGKWHQFRDEQTKAALRSWCEENGCTLQ